MKRGRLFFILFFSIFIQELFVINSQPDEYTISLEYTIEIIDVKIDDYSTKINLNIKLRDFPYESDKVTIIIQGIENHKISLNSTGGYTKHWSYQGNLKNKLFFIEGYGELFPYDFYKIYINLYPHHLEYYEKNQIYGLTNFNFNINVEDSSVHFTGIKNRLLTNTWRKGMIKDGTTLYILLNRKSSFFYRLILLPLFIIAITIFFTPVLNTNVLNRVINIRIYSSILVFLIGFIFTIQNHIPVRSTLSIPEFFGTYLISMSALSILFSLYDPINNRINIFYRHDILLIIISSVVYVLYFYTVYYPYRNIIVNNIIYILVFSLLPMVISICAFSRKKIKAGF